MTRVMPSVLPDHGLFAFSGFDGRTESQARFVGVLSSKRTSPSGSLAIRVDFDPTSRRAIEVWLNEPVEIEAALSDVIIGRCGGAQFVLTYTAWHTLVGHMPKGCTLRAYSDVGQEVALDAVDDSFVDDAGHDALCITRTAQRFAVGYGQNVVEARARAEQGLRDDVGQWVDGRLRWYESVPALPDYGETELLRKCASVMRVNTYSERDRYSTKWSTPDRVPHRSMWLWDSVFHSLGMNKDRKSVV